MSYHNNRGRGGASSRGGGPFRGDTPARGVSPLSGGAPARRSRPPFRGGGGSGFSSSHRGGRGGGGTREIVIFKGDSPATIQPHLDDQNLDSLVSTLSTLRINTPKRPVRPGFGTLGTAIKVRANFFAFNIEEGQRFYEYNVDISGRTGPKGKIPNGKKIRLFELLELHPDFVQYNPFVVHDRSAKLYSAEELPQPLVFDIKYFDDHQEGPESNADEYRVELEFVKEHDSSALNDYLDGKPQAKNLDIQPLITALNLISGKFATNRGIRVGRPVSKYFYEPDRRNVLSIQIEAWQGFSVSVRPAYKQLMVNVNVCMAAFVTPGNLADKLKLFNMASHGGMLTLPQGLVKSIKIRTTHLGYKKSVHQIMSTSARQTSFIKDTGERVTVEKYFEQTYEMKLEHPTDLPVINVGTKQNPIYVPAELCEWRTARGTSAVRFLGHESLSGHRREILPGCIFRDRLSAFETSKMLNVACNPPHENAQAITETGFPFLGFSQQNSPLEPFGISIDPEMAVIPARILTPPRISGSKPITNVSKASWYFNNVKFVRGARIDTWDVLIVQDGRNEVNVGEVDGIVNGFATKLRKCGVGVPEKLPKKRKITLVNPRYDDDSRSKSVKMIREGLIGSGNVSFILVLLNNVDKVVYPAIKKIGDVELGIHTVCMQVDKASKKGEIYYGNVALKLNIKLGGINHKLDDLTWLTKKSTMMVGIDVTHAGPTSRYGTPSIAAVVANVDDSFVHFPASIRIQAVAYNKEAKEMVTDLAEMMYERLLAYQSKMKNLPERVFVFRDGVSEGQFDVVLRDELPCFSQAFEKMKMPDGEAYQPKLSIVICGKRHHARFYPTNRAHASQNGNTLPGTVVDKGITAVFDFDFYLQPHDGIKGSVKSTHYTVIYDENNFSADEIQKGTHDASYLYARATKAVSLIPAAYYADLACERGRCYLNDFLVSVDGKSSSGSGGKKGREEEKDEVFRAAKEAWGDGVHPKMRGSMFYI